MLLNCIIVSIFRWYIWECFNYLFYSVSTHMCSWLRVSIFRLCKQAIMIGVIKWWQETPFSERRSDVFSCDRESVVGCYFSVFCWECLTLAKNNGRACSTRHRRLQRLQYDTSCETPTHSTGSCMQDSEHSIAERLRGIDLRKLCLWFSMQ